MTGSKRGGQPLSTEEQALARALSSLPAGEPSPELDRRILALARAPAAADAPSRRRRRGPWRFRLATAATVVLAVGVVWQLLESPSPDQQRAHGLSSSPAMGDLEGVEIAVPTAPADHPRTVAPAGEPDAPSPMAARARARQDGPMPQAERSPSPAPARAPSGAGQASGERAEPAPPPPPAPMAPPVTQTPSPASAPLPARSSIDELSTADLADDTAVVAESPDPAHLERQYTQIRRLLRRGEPDAAKKAAEALLERHPGLELPEDLTHLVEQSAPGSEPGH